MGRSPCCDKTGLKKGPWTTEEDTKLTQYIQAHGPGNWRTLPKNAGLERCGKSCRLRWANYLRPDIKRGRFSFEEEESIIQLHSVLGNKWSAIAARLPGRTDNEIKNYWNTHIRKRLLRTGIDPVTHTPRVDLSSLLASPQLNLVQNLLRLHTLLNPEALRLATSLVSSQYENQLLLNSSQQQQINMNYQAQPSSLIQPNQFDNIIDQQIPSLHNSYGVNNPEEMITRPELSDNNSSFQSLNASSSQNYGLDSVLSNPGDSFCSDLLRFEIPEGLNFDEFIM